MGYKIISKEKLHPTIGKMVIEAPLVARHAFAGEFIILRVDENGERIPLTIHDYDKEKGTITIIYQVVGLSTYKLDLLNENEEILDFVGPLGKKTNIENVKKALVIGGGVGTAISYPICKAIKNNGGFVDAIVGYKNKDYVILEEEFKNTCDNTYIYTDDGSYATKGFVTQDLESLLLKNNYDEVFVIGSLMMMKNVCIITKKLNVKTTVSMNPIMIDGTGMCGGCRLSVDGKTKFACVDGPDFDGFKVDFDEVIKRNKMYLNEERHKYEEKCNLFKEVK